VDRAVLLEVLESSIPSLRPSLVALGGGGDEAAMACLRWFVSLFTNPLPPSFAARVWDSLLFGGRKVLFRAATALLRTLYVRGPPPASFSDAMVVLDGLGDQVWDRADVPLYFGPPPAAVAGGGGGGAGPASVHLLYLPAHRESGRRRRARSSRHGSASGSDSGSGRGGDGSRSGGRLRRGPGSRSALDLASAAATPGRATPVGLDGGAAGGAVPGLDSPPPTVPRMVLDDGGADEGPSEPASPLVVPVAAAAVLGGEPLPARPAEAVVGGGGSGPVVACGGADNGAEAVAGTCARMPGGGGGGQPVFDRFSSGSSSGSSSDDDSGSSEWGGEGCGVEEAQATLSPVLGVSLLGPTRHLGVDSPGSPGGPCSPIQRISGVAALAQHRSAPSTPKGGPRAVVPLPQVVEAAASSTDDFQSEEERGAARGGAGSTAAVAAVGAAPAAALPQLVAPPSPPRRGLRGGAEVGHREGASSRATLASRRLQQYLLLPRFGVVWRERIFCSRCGGGPHPGAGQGVKTLPSRWGRVLVLHACASSAPPFPPPPPKSTLSPNPGAVLCARAFRRCLVGSLCRHLLDALYAKHNPVAGGQGPHALLAPGDGPDAPDRLWSCVYPLVLQPPPAPPHAAASGPGGASKSPVAGQGLGPGQGQGQGQGSVPSRAVVARPGAWLPHCEEHFTARGERCGASPALLLGQGAPGDGTGGGAGGAGGRTTGGPDGGAEDARRVRPGGAASPPLLPQLEMDLELLARHMPCLEGGKLGGSLIAACVSDGAGAPRRRSDATIVGWLPDREGPARASLRSFVIENYYSVGRVGVPV
jgi:hypothetical protein